MVTSKKMMKMEKRKVILRGFITISFFLHDNDLRMISQSELFWSLLSSQSVLELSALIAKVDSDPQL
jgi:hypothetical protein